MFDARLVAQCEWGNGKEIVKDFHKLLQARADVRLTIFGGNHKSDSGGVAEQLAGKQVRRQGQRPACLAALLVLALLVFWWQWNVTETHYWSETPRTAIACDSGFSGKVPRERRGSLRC